MTLGKRFLIVYKCLLKFTHKIIIFCKWGDAVSDWRGQGYSLPLSQENGITAIFRPKARIVQLGCKRLYSYMQKIRSSPLLSLVLLFITYIVLGWRLYINTFGWGLCYGQLFELTFSFRCKWWVLILTVALILLLAETLASPLSQMRKLISLAFQSDTRAFITLIVLAFFIALLIIWISFVAYILLLITTALRARLDMIMYGFKGWQAFFTLAIISLSGFLIGWIAPSLTLSL